MMTPAVTEPKPTGQRIPHLADRQTAGNVVCRNCETLLHGPYCSACGQLDSPPDPSLREILADAWESLTDLDGKILASLKLLLGRPGALTREYLAGRRVRYIPPFRLYFLCSVAFFLVDAVGKDGPPEGGVGSARATVRVSSDSVRAVLDSIRGRVPVAAPAAAPDARASRPNRFERGLQRLGEDPESRVAKVAELVPNAMFLLMPVYAAILAVLYRSRRRRYPGHLVFALHAHAFFFATLVLMELGEFLSATVPVVGRVIDGAVFLWIMAYFPIALRSVYGGRWGAAILRATALGTAYSLVGLLLTASAFAGYAYWLGG
jgi:hypothetical protein